MASLFLAGRAAAGGIGLGGLGEGGLPPEMAAPRASGPGSDSIKQIRLVTQNCGKNLLGAAELAKLLSGEVVEEVSDMSWDSLIVEQKQLE